MTLCWANPICVFEKSIREMRAEEIKKGSNRRLSRSPEKVIETLGTHSPDTRYRYSCSSGGKQDIISDTLRGFPPTLDEMMESYKEHQERLYENAEDEECAYYGAVEDLNFGSGAKTNKK